MNRKVVSVALAMVLATSYMGSTVYADPYSDRTRQQQQYNEDKNKYKSAQEIVDEIEANIQEVDTQISELYLKIEETNNKISATENQIKISEQGVQAAVESIKKEEELFNKRMRSMYINGMDSYVEILFNSKGLGDFIARLENVTKIISYDKEITTSLTEKKIALEQKKNVLEQEKIQLVALQKDNDVKAEELKVKKEEHEKVMEVAQANAEVFETAMRESKAQLAETNRQIEALQRPSRGGDDFEAPTGSGSGAGIVGYAKNFLGRPYKWGGNGPNSFDCSGFTRYVYREFGITLPRTAASQMSVGSSVSRSQLQPGDLVFFGRGGNINHVGIYVGNNSYIHSPQTGDVVKISPLTRSDYAGARRF